MPRKPTTPRKKPSARRSRASAGTIREDALYEEIADLLRTMPSDWRRQYRSGRDKLGAIGGPMLPDTPSPEQAMLLIGITAGGNPSGDSPFGPHRVPAAVRQAAMKGIRLSHANNYGAWDFIGLARAIELVIVPSVSDTTFKRMGLYLFRHKKDALGSNFGNDANPSRGYMAWLNWGGDPAVPWTRAFERNPASYRIETSAARNGREGYVAAVLNGETVGSIVLLSSASEVNAWADEAGDFRFVGLPRGQGGWFEGIEIDPSLRGQGTGRSMVADMLEAAREEGAKYVALDASPSAHGFWLRMGFEEWDYEGAAFDTIPMVKVF
jgi:GNAT superfamily N-acetyltransferase